MFCHILFFYRQQFAAQPINPYDGKQPVGISDGELLCLPEETIRLEELSREGSPERRL